MNALIEVETSTHEDFNGRRYIQYTPILRPDCCAIGELRFAVWQVWEDEPATHAPAKAKAIANAKHVLSSYASC